MQTFIVMFALKVAFFRKYDAFFSLPKKCAENHLEIKILKLCLESTDSNCTVVSGGSKIQNANPRIERGTFFRAMEIIKIFF